VLRTLPSTELRARCDFRENKPFRDDKMPDVYAVPPMSVRVHDNVLCAPRQVAVQGNLALPDSFRWNADPVLRNRFLSDLGPRFAPDPAEGRRPRRLEGTYFYFDSEWTNHFGHAITEQLSRLWAVPAAREHHPDLKVLLDRRNGRTDISSYELEILQAVGFTRDDIVLHHRPVRVERLVAASPMWVLPRHVHPDIGRLWQDIGQRIADRAEDAPSWPRIFVSRRRDRRSCLNRPEVERLFASHGFEIVHPEELPFTAQVKMFRSAEVIAGFSGSGMFNMQFCDTPRHAIVLSPTSYPSRNEYMISAVVGHRLDYVWSPPDPVQARGPEPRYAGFTFDFQDEGVFLEHVLAGL
jgi:capsular polysaccharide biosynthesis protein